MSRIRQAKAALLDRLEAIVRELVPGGRKNGSTYTAKNPARADRTAGSFVVWLRGPAAGGWKDYATGEQGDIIDLVALAKATDRKGALAWAEDRCGLRSMAEADRRAMEAAAAQRRREAEKHDQANALRKIDRARKMFASGSPEILGTPVETYLASRGIPLREIKFLEDSFRFHPSLEWWMGRRDGVPGPRFPAMLSQMVDGEGVPKALHVTFIAPDGRGKAPVEKPKLMWPATSGLVIRVTRGAGNRNAETAAKLGKPAACGIWEGIEDTLSVALAVPELRLWAAGSLPNYLHVPDHACVDGWILGRDNDWGKEQAQALFSRAFEHFERTGKPVTAVNATGEAKDMNDLLRGE
ncbi:DUF7146 domain-containing protein [Kaistia sp. MMO-174]|uniref:DUF7146 domain-containing protein n=1 Tax=Kaistia sp. MMO-174 TaxID=3081256 RepID=UPI003017649C